MCTPIELMQPNTLQAKIYKAKENLKHMEACHPRVYAKVSPVLLELIAALEIVRVQLDQANATTITGTDEV